MSVWLLTLALHHCHLQKTIDTCGKKVQASLADVLYHAVPYVRIRGNASGDKSQSHSHMVSGSSVSVSVSVSVYQSHSHRCCCYCVDLGQRDPGPADKRQPAGQQKKNKKTGKKQKKRRFVLREKKHLLIFCLFCLFPTIPFCSRFHLFHSCLSQLL